MKMKAERQIRETILKHNLIKRGDHIVIGLSGGPDSMCLYDVLLKLAEEMNLIVHPVHVNHKFRPGAAERDQAFVECLCEKNAASNPGITRLCRSFTVDCNALAEETGMTSEEAGRKARYDAFFRVAEEIGAELCEEGFEKNPAHAKVKIAVAQNANDQAETIMFRILRGTGTDGLAGIAYEREEGQTSAGSRKSYKVIRPLLDTWRRDIEEYCETEELNPVTDHTNSEEIYSRNKIRLDLIPHLRDKYNENIEAGLNRLGAIAAADKDYFWKETNRVLEELRLIKDRAGTPFGDDVVVLDREGLAACHEAIRHRVVQKAFEEIGLVRDITAERLEGADAIIGKKQGEKVVEFPHGYRIRVAKGRVYFEKVEIVQI